MRRCLSLAALASGYTSPNPMVGAVLVHNNRIIGEGYHREYGKNHAEVNCIASVKPVDRRLISQSTLFVSLEPCAHYGKTPPCSDLIISNNIPEVVIGCRDPFEKVNGRGIEKLRDAGIKTLAGILEDECRDLNKRFFTFHTMNRPYVILKWAESLDGKIASENGKRLFISNEYSNRLVHKWRSEEMSILVGTDTALLDNPELTVRLWPGRNPVRLVIDRELRLPSDLKIFDSSAPSVVFNLKKHTLPPGRFFLTDLELCGPHYYQLTDTENIVSQIINALWQMNIISVMAEGGVKLLQSFIDESAWDEIRVITNQRLIVADGLSSPEIKNNRMVNNEDFYGDTIRTYNPINQRI